MPKAMEPHIVSDTSQISFVTVRLVTSSTPQESMFHIFINNLHDDKAKSFLSQNLDGFCPFMP